MSLRVHRVGGVDRDTALVLNLEPIRHTVYILYWEEEDTVLFYIQEHTIVSSRGEFSNLRREVVMRAYLFWGGEYGVSMEMLSGTVL